MKPKLILFLVLLIFLYSCSINEYRQLKNGNIISPENVEYSFFAYEGTYVVFGERSFISHILFQPRKLRHLGSSINAGIYSLNTDPNLTILYRVKYNSEYYELYIKKELSERNYSYENCISFKFLDTKSTFAGYYQANIEHFEALENITGINDNTEIKRFLEDIENNEIFTEEHFFNFMRNPFDFMGGNNEFIGYVYGFFQDIPNISFPGTVWIDDNRSYYLIMDRRMFNISIDWLKKLGYDG